MDLDNEKSEDIDAKRRDIELRVERFREQCQLYLKRLPILKRQLDEINRLNQFDLYVQKLNEIGKIVQNLVQNLKNIETLHARLNQNDRSKIEEQIRLLRVEIDREMSEFHQLREQAMQVSSQREIAMSDDDQTRSGLPDQTETELRQRHVTPADQLNDSYDLLEQDLILLRDTIGEVAQLVAQQRQTIIQTDHLIHSAQNHIQHASTLLQKAVHNKYVTLASGALLGATLAGPVGFLMGMKIGALAALSGSAVGALSANIMQQRMVRQETPQENSNAYNQAML